MTGLQSLSVQDLLRMHSSVLDELRERKILRSSNSPSGDYAELLFKTAFNWKLEGNSVAGFDATDSNGVRYQIKCRRITPWNSSRQLSAIRRLDGKPFDFLAGVLLDKDYLVLRAALIPIAVVLQNSKFTSHVNAWRMILRDLVWGMDNVRDVTAELKAAEKMI